MNEIRMKKMLYEAGQRVRLSERTNIIDQLTLLRSTSVCSGFEFCAE